MIPVRMRFDDIPQEWRDRAGALTRQLLEAKDDPETNEDGTPRRHRRLAQEKRKSLIKANSSLWGELKPIFLRWSFGKCWYSEARDIGSDYHVDHFRPKGRVANHPECPGNSREVEGYWWLAFDWRNYRVACSICNSPHTEDGETLGKWDYFPLCTNDAVHSPTANIDEEIPLLLDPTRESDVRLVTFRETGEAVPAVPVGSHVWRRVSLAIKILNLNSTPLKEERRRVVGEMRSLLDLLDELYRRPLRNQDQYFQGDVNRILEDIRKNTAPDRELCGAARAAVKLSGNHYAIEKLAPLDGSVLYDERWRSSELGTAPAVAGPSTDGAYDSLAAGETSARTEVASEEQSGSREGEERAQENLSLPAPSGESSEAPELKG